jgi:polyisoprenoid-binding protein YceI
VFGVMMKSLLPDHSIKSKSAVCLSILLAMMLFAATLSAATYTVDENKSRINIHVGKTGALSAAGHEHDVRATRFSGKVVLDLATPQKASLELTLQAAGLRVLAEKEPPGDAPKVQDAMAGPQCLDVRKFPTISFHSSKVDPKQSSGNVWTINLTGDLDLHGTKKTLTFPVTVTGDDKMLTANGQVTFKQTDFGIKPIRAAGGTVNVKDELLMSFTIVANGSNEVRP